MKKLHTSLIFSNLMVTKPLNTIYLLMRNFITNFVRILGICKDFAGNRVNELGNVPRCGVVPKFSDPEVIALGITDEALHIDSENYLFCGSDASAVRASMIYSFIATCKACGIEPREWFEDVIRRIPEYENGRSDVTHLLPKNWKRNFNDCNQR